MATSSRIRGNILPILTAKIGAGAATDISQDVKAVSITSDDKDDSDLTFAEAAAGAGVDYTLTLRGITSFDTASLWNYLWTNAGTVVQITYGPKGNATPTATSPHFQASYTLKRPDLEFEASLDITGAEFEIDLLATTDLVKLIA